MSLLRLTVIPTELSLRVSELSWSGCGHRRLSVSDAIQTQLLHPHCPRPTPLTATVRVVHHYTSGRVSCCAADSGMRCRRG